MVLSLKDKWIWDFWLVDNTTSDDGKWHIYFLQADNTLPHPDDRHRNVTQAHAVSDDLVNWTHLGTCFRPSEGPAWDDWTTWTGSVVKGDKGLWHLFYTGTMRDLAGMHQRIGHATSTDMHNWKRVKTDSRIGDGLVLDLTGPNAKYYEEFTPGHWHDRAMRDPWVMRDPKGKGWVMYFTARVPGRDEPNAGGAIGFATSPDLQTWTLQKPIYAGGDFGQLEVPQVLQVGKKWYCLFCTSGFQWSKKYRKSLRQKPVTGTHYLVANSHTGPWKVAPGKFLDGRLPTGRYSGKIVNDNGALKLLAFTEKDKRGGPVLTVCDPVPVSIDKTGLFQLKV